MRDLEKEMADALEGKFFYEPTSKYDLYPTLGGSEIRKVQKEIRRKYKRPGLAVNHQAVLSIKHTRENVLGKLSRTYETLVPILAKMYDIEEEDLRGRCKKEKVALVRTQLVGLLKRYNKDASFARIGKIAGRDHSTVVYSVKKFKERENEYKEQTDKIDEIVGFQKYSGNDALPL